MDGHCGGSQAVSEVPAAAQSHASDALAHSSDSYADLSSSASPSDSGRLASSREFEDSSPHEGPHILCSKYSAPKAFKDARSSFGIHSVDLEDRTLQKGVH
jgi:hypothetical protein